MYLKFAAVAVIASTATAIAVLLILKAFAGVFSLWIATLPVLIAYLAVSIDFVFKAWKPRPKELKGNRFDAFRSINFNAGKKKDGQSKIEGLKFKPDGRRTHSQSIQEMPLQQLQIWQSQIVENGAIPFFVCGDINRVEDDQIWNRALGKLGKYNISSLHNLTDGIDSANLCTLLSTSNLLSLFETDETADLMTQALDTLPKEDQKLIKLMRLRPEGTIDWKEIADQLDLKNVSHIRLSTLKKRAEIAMFSLQAAYLASIVYTCVNTREESHDSNA